MGSEGGLCKKDGTMQRFEEIEQPCLRDVDGDFVAHNWREAE
jgi:hypothetical protein